MDESFMNDNDAAIAAADRESRYGHLLEPIRDLAANWNIDVAGELEEYLAELEQIRITFEPSQLSQSSQPSLSQGFSLSQADGTKTLNFAQAALLIQGSACIYSKKVEYLYALLYQTLDVLIDKRKSKQAASSISSQTGDDLDALLFADTDGALLDLDDTMVEGKNIDLKEDQDSEDQRGDEKRQDTLLIRAPLSLLSDNPFNTTTDAKDSSSAAQQSLAAQFKISGCLMHPSGALLLEEKEAALLKNNDQLEFDPKLLRAQGVTSAMLNSAAASLPFGSPKAILLQNIQDAKKEEGIVALQFDEHDHDFIGGDGGGHGGFDDDDDSGEMEHKYDDEQKEVMPAAPAAANKKSVRFADDLEDELQATTSKSSRSQLAEHEEDLWSELDPHDSGTLKPHPFRRGQTCRRPYVPEIENLEDVSADIKIHLLNSMHQNNPAQAILMRGIAKQNINAPFFAEFSTLFLREQEKRKKRKRTAPKSSPAASALRKSSSSSSNSLDGMIPLQDQDDDGDNMPIGSSDDFGDADGRGGGGFDVDFDSAFQLAGLDQDPTSAVQDELDQWEQAGGASVKDFTGAAASAAGLESSLATLEKSYEQLCREHVEAYLKSAEQYLTSSVLSRRVLEWQEKLLPILEAEELHRVYDIQSYGRAILDTLNTKKDERDELNFEQAVEGQERFEICRMFLATLQLANAGNLDITPATMSSNRAASSMSLKLLSMDDKNLEGLDDMQQSPEMKDDTVDSSAAAPKKSRSNAGKNKRKQATITDENDVPSSMETEISSSQKSSLSSLVDLVPFSQPTKSSSTVSTTSSKKAPLSSQDTNRRATRRAAH